MRTRILLTTLFSMLTAVTALAAIPDSLRAEFSQLADTAEIRQLLARSKQVMYMDPELGGHYADLALEKAADYPEMLPTANMQRGVISWVLSDHGEALSYFQLGKSQAADLGDSLSVAKANNNLSLVYTELSTYDRALEYALEALQYFEQQELSTLIATVRLNIGNIYNRNGNDANAEDYYRKALEVFETLNDTNSICMVYNNLGLMLKDNGRVAEAIQHFQTALDGYLALGYLYGQTKVMSNLGTSYAHLEQFTQSEDMHLRSLDIAKQIDNPREIAISQYNLGELYRKQRQFQRAIEVITESLNLIEGSGDLLLEATNHHGLSDCHERLGEFERSLFHHKRFKELNDSIFNETKAKALTEMQVRYETDLKNKEIQNLEQQKALDWQRKLGLGIALGLLLVIGLLVFMRQRGVIRREKALKEKDREVHQAQAALAEAEIKSSELEKLRLQEELDYKTREITNLAMNIVRRNDLLEVMDRELKELRKGVDEKKLKDLSVMVSQTLSLENERKEFQIFIQEAQQNFFLKLEERYPSLSQKEKRLCAMIKLGLSSKEIAAVFNIATSSVEVARYRLRKKLELTKSEGLKDFLSGF